MNKFDRIQKLHLIIAGRRPPVSLLELIDRMECKEATAVLKRRRLEIKYHSRSNNKLSNRLISPRRKIYYRENRYMDGWCHERKALRTFSLDGIRKIQSLKQTAQEISDETLDKYFTLTYGLLGGPAASTAVLRFTSIWARRVADEQLHPDQEGRFLEDSSYILRIPYADYRELLLDIFKYGPDVEVLEPEEWRSEVKRHLRLALKKYEKEKKLPDHVLMHRWGRLEMKNREFKG